VPLVYCDHNFIVTAGQGPESYKDYLRRLSIAGTVTFVLSPIHWVDMAEDADVGRSESTADFIDSLGSKWLRERRNIQRIEVEAVFFRFAKIPSETPMMVVNVSDVIADLAGKPGERPSRDFVTHLRGVGPDHPLKQSVQLAFDANQANTANHKNGCLKADILKKIESIYIQRLLPTRTPAGIVIDEGSKKEFLDQYKLTDFPALALETRATQDNWAEERPLGRNNFLDQQHVMALPYVDLFITNDRKLTNLIGKIVADAPFKCATVVTKEQFDASYP
jgi:hypothetical protein